MHEQLTEFFDSRGAAPRIDREGAVLRGVKVLGLESRNGRTYMPEALEQAAALYEGAKVNVNHPLCGPLSPRGYEERIGLLRGAHVRPGGGLFADFHFNPKHALAEQLLWDAEHAPENVGFSHHVEAKTAKQGDRTVVEAILKVQAVDLVADPATTRGLFESVGEAAALREENVRLRTQLQELAGKQAQQERQSLIERLLAEFRLPLPESDEADGAAIVSEEFLESLRSAPDEQRVRQLTAERARLVRSLRERPVSRERAPVSDQFPAGPLDARGFAAALR